MVMPHIHTPRIRPAQIKVYVIALCVLLAVLLWSLSAGSYVLSPVQVLSTLWNPQAGYAQLVIWDIRLPRLLVGTTAGALLGISGAIFQSIIRNPLASPDVIGFNSGIALGAVVALVVFDATGYGLILGAVGGGIITAVLVMGLAWKAPPASKHAPRLSVFVHLWRHARAYGFVPYRIVLIGIGCAFTITAVTNFILTTTDVYRASDAMIWLIGSVGGKTWQSVAIAISGLSVLLPCALYLENHMRILEMGNDIAISLGVHINRIRIFAIVLGILLSSVAVSVVGPIGFVAFVSGPIARRISTTAGINVGLSAIVGGIILTFADLMGRVAIPGLPLSAGIYTAIIGGPYLLWLLSQNIKRGEL